MRARITILAVLGLLLLTVLWPVSARRRMTPLTSPATMTQSINETADDTARINAKRRANSVSYVDEKGRTMYVDTVTGEEWTDSTVISMVPKMEFPLLHSLSVGINVWDPLMRAFGQHYGIADAWVEVSLHNRYNPVVEVGLGTAHYRPSGSDFTYRSPVSPYFRIGINYNFLFNSDPAYLFFAGVRYGFSNFSYSVDDVTLAGGYWGETSRFSIPSQRSTVGWGEFMLGLRVKLWGPISAGWTVKYQTLMHQSRDMYGKPWYIPGYGARGTNVTGSFSVVYTFGLSHLNKKLPDDVLNEIAQGEAIPAAADSIPADTVKTSL